MTTNQTPADQVEQLRRVAGIRQGVINKLEKRLKRLEAENRTLRGIDL